MKKINPPPTTVRLTLTAKPTTHYRSADAHGEAHYPLPITNYPLPIMKSTAISNQAKQPNHLLSKFKTPQLIKGGLYCTWGASLLLLIATISGVQGQRYGIKTVGQDSAPSILNAQRIKDSLADMDANAANELLVKPGQNPEAIKGFNARREKLAGLLVDVAENITYGEAEKAPIRTIVEQSGNYMQKIQQARDFNARGDTNGVITTYREAVEIMDKTLLPAADELAKVNLSQLEITYNRERFAAGRSLFFIFLSGLLLIGTLVGIQLFLNYRMRRMLNPMLLAATAIATIFLGYAIQALSVSSNHLKVAKQDSFVSLLALRKARSIAYRANAAESRYLLDKEGVTLHEQAFFNNVDQIAKLPNSRNFGAVANTVAQGKPVPSMAGFLADALNNITFAGEREAAVATLKTWDTYLILDTQIRQLERSGKHAEAIALCTGYDPGQSNWAFEQFKDAHQKFLDVNQKQFEDAIARGAKQVDGLEITTAIVAASVSLLTLFGLLPRMKEYQ